MTTLLRHVAAALMVGVFAVVLNGQTGEVNLLWDASESSDVRSYKVYHALNSAKIWPTDWRLVGNTASLTFVHSNLALGNHRWVVTAISGYGFESIPSEEVAILLERPEPPPLLALELPKRQLMLKVGSSGVSSAILFRSSDLKNWSKIHEWEEPTNGASFFRIEVPGPRLDQSPLLAPAAR